MKKTNKQTNQKNLKKQLYFQPLVLIPTLSNDL